MNIAHKRHELRDAESHPNSNGFINSFTPVTILTPNQLSFCPLSASVLLLELLVNPHSIRMHPRKIDIFITYISIAYWCHSNNSKRLLQIRSLTTQMSFSVQTEVLESYKYQNREELKEHQAGTNIRRAIICLPVCLCGY